MRFTKALGAAAALCLLLAACTPKAMETFSAWEPEILLYPGDTWEGEIPGDGEEAAYTISVNTVPGLEARLEGGKLIPPPSRGAGSSPWPPPPRATWIPTSPCRCGWRPTPWSWTGR